MKLTLFLLFFVLHSTGAASKNSSFKRLSEFYAKENPTTEADKTRVSCIAVFCHFENKQGCMKACKTYGELRLPENKMKEVKPTNEKACSTGCVINMKNDKRAAGVCSILCSVDFSYPNRDKWLKEIDQAFEKHSR